MLYKKRSNTNLEHSSFISMRSLPSLVGQNRLNTFNDIKEKLAKSLASCKEKLLSKAGKEVLIKATQAISTYFMSCFKIPDSPCQLIQRVALAHTIAIFVNFGSNYGIYQFPVRYIILHEGLAMIFSPQRRIYGIGMSSTKSYVRNVKWEMNHRVISFGFVQELVECGTFLSCLVYNVMPILTFFMTVCGVLWWWINLRRRSFV